MSQKKKKRQNPKVLFKRFIYVFYVYEYMLEREADPITAAISPARVLFLLVGLERFLLCMCGV